MKFTGERFVPTEQGKIRIEHYHRYAMVLEVVKGKVVLDVACGEGYGSFFLSEVAHTVVGVDISDDAIRHALSNYDKPNLNFLQGSATNLAFPNDSFDVVVSFETIEHLMAQEEMLAEIRRVLRADGVLIISSPNRPIYSEESSEHNEFHVKELDFQEFDELLRTQFSEIEYSGQRLLISSVIQPLYTSPKSSAVWSDDGVQLSNKAGEFKDPVYFLAVCGASNVSLPHLGMSTLYPESIDLVKYYVGFAKWAQSLEKIVAERDVQIADRDAQLAEFRRSFFGRLATLFRKILNLTVSSAPLAKHYIRAGLRMVKRFYQWLPLSVQTKAKHRQWIAKLFPRLLLATGSHSTTLPLYNIPKLDIHSLIGDNVLIDPETLLIPSSETPLVSVIIPIYGKVDYTLRCLASISQNSPDTAFEVILVDDCSPDHSFEILSKVKTIRLISNEQNLGFIRSCNRGAQAAKGKYLHFLNNDTQVMTGWLDELLHTFTELPGTGLVGSKLIYPDGRLQEAGGIVWRDGSAWNFGRFQDPQLPVYNYAREVDYCSGASIMVPKELFDELGGFDEHYLPAYCEDSDLALKIREKGQRVIYQPLSEVVHFEGITSGTDTTQGTKSYQVENSKKLFDRWQHRLAVHQIPGTELDAAKDRCAVHRVLVLDHCTPMPNQDAGSVTVFNLLMLLRELGFQVTFIPEDNFRYMPDYTNSMQRAGVEILYAPYTVSVEQHLKEYGERYDLAFLFRPGVAERHLQAIRKYCTNAKVLYHTVDLHFLRMSREAELQSDEAKQKVASEMRQRELAAIGSADASIVHSTTELEVLRPLVPEAKLHVFPLIMDVQGTHIPFQERKNIVFVGSYQHTPNVDAVKYFAKKVMPLLRMKLPGIRFYVVGSRPSAEVLELASEDIIITGFVEDLTSLLNKMRVSVAPLRYGAGIKGKIGSSMAVGLPVVGSPLAVEGMSLTDGENILVADGATAFADSVVKIYQDEALWSRISESGISFARQAWGGEAALAILQTILIDMGMKVKRGAYELSLYSECPSPHSTRKLLKPVGSVKSRNDYIKLIENNALKKTDQLAMQLRVRSDNEAFTVGGFCVPCNKKVSLLVDMQSGGQRDVNGWTPNWRERLECPTCLMNNRQRLIATLLQQALSGKQVQKVYLMEQVTPIFNWALKTFREHELFGSEYLGHEYAGGTIVKGVRHEDIENLSFVDGQLDLIVSNDVFEHVPNPAKAFSECARVLKSGGLMLMTIPFHSGNDLSVVRARLIDGRLEHVLAPAFHGNPVSADGSLVFTDFGWDLLETIKDAGFSDVAIDVYSSIKFGHLGGGQIVFRLTN